MSEPTEATPRLAVLLDVPVQISAQLASCRKPLAEVLRLAPGALLRLEKAANTPVEIYANRKRIGCGNVLVADNCLGVKITELLA